MDCRVFLDVMSQFEAGELSGELRLEVEKHANSCPKCNSELENFKRAVSLCGNAMDAKMGLAASLRMYASVSKCLSESSRPIFGPILSVRDLATYLTVNEDVLETYLNEIPCFELGGKILFRKEKVEEWISKRERQFALDLLRSRIERDLRGNVVEPIRKGGRIWRL